MQEHKEWLEHADRDLKAAQILLSSQEAVLLPALYHIYMPNEE